MAAAFAADMLLADDVIGTLRKLGGVERDAPPVLQQSAPAASTSPGK